MNFIAPARTSSPAAGRAPVGGARHDEAPSATVAQGTVATSFAVFEPVDCVMLGRPGDAPAEAVVLALRHAGWAPAALQRFAPRKSIDALEALVDRAGALSGHGDEFARLHRHLALSRQGCRWLRVRIGGIEHAAMAAELARRCGALMAVHCRRLTVDGLLWCPTTPWPASARPPSGQPQRLPRRRRRHRPARPPRRRGHVPRQAWRRRPLGLPRQHGHAGRGPHRRAPVLTRARRRYGGCPTRHVRPSDRRNAGYDRSPNRQAALRERR